MQRHSFAIFSIGAGNSIVSDLLAQPAMHLAMTGIYPQHKSRTSGEKHICRQVYRIG